MISKKPKLAILLCAGFGKRLWPATQIIPKPLMPILGKPLLYHWLKNLSDIGIKVVVINTFYKADLIENWVKFYKKEFSNLEILLCTENWPAGTAGAVRLHIKQLISDKDDNSSCLVIHADNYIFSSLSKVMCEAEEKNNIKIIMSTFETDRPENAGIVALDENMIVREMHEKTKIARGKIANGAIYIFSREVLEAIFSNDDINDISRDVIPKFLGEIKAVPLKGGLVDIGDMTSLKSLKMKLENLPVSFSTHDILSECLDIANMTKMNLSQVS